MCLGAIEATMAENPMPRIRSSSRISRKSYCFNDEAEKLMGESETASTTSSQDTERDSENLDECEEPIIAWEDYK